MPEWLNGAVSKTVDLARDPGVRIPLSPPTVKSAAERRFLFGTNGKLAFSFGANKKRSTKCALFAVEASPSKGSCK